MLQSLVDSKKAKVCLFVINFGPVIFYCLKLLVKYFISFSQEINQITPTSQIVECVPPPLEPEPEEMWPL